ncbi:MAG: hypothetical protein ACMXX7_00130 [Candidatus Woesearchaeota archaeon]
MLVFKEDRKKGQSAIEFAILLGFILIAVSGLFVILSSTLERYELNKDNAVIDQIVNLVQTEILFAESAEGNFQREFFLPMTIDGFSYEVSLNDPRELFVRYKGIERVHFFSTDIYGDINRGSNLVQKICQVDCTITVNP